MKLTRMKFLMTLIALFTVTTGAFAARMGDIATTAQFAGPKANTGTATLSKENGKAMLRVSDDFRVPDTPAPTWRVVDSKGNTYTLDAFKIKGGSGEKREVVVPSFIHDVVKVQVYCAWAEVLLGEASFGKTVAAN